MIIRPWDGKPIREPGVYSGIPIETYHSAVICAPEMKISSSGLKRIFNDSPAHYWDQSPYNAKREVAEDAEVSKSITRGRAAHAVLLGSEVFSDKFIIHPEHLMNPETKKMRKWHGNNTECRAWVASVPRGKTVLGLDDAEAVRAMALQIGRHPIAGQGLLNGHVELSAFWRDKETGIWLSIRPDVIPNASGDFADLKTTRSTAYNSMQKSLFEFGYAQQAALCAEGCGVLGLPFTSFTLAFVENKRPHCVATEMIKDETLMDGMHMNRAALRRFKHCIDTFGVTADATWPGPRGEQHDVEYLDFTDRDRSYIQDRLKFEFDYDEAA